MPLKIDHKYIIEAVNIALKEDVGTGDITTSRTADKNKKAKGVIYAQADGVLAGMPLVKHIFQQLDKKVRFIPYKQDGETVKKGMALCMLQGPAAPILTGERTALNFLGLLSGIATKTAQFVYMVKGTSTVILDTRKTIPGLRHLVKYAVAAGGGVNHRFGLYDAILIKDNHIEMAGSITNAIKAIRQKGNRKITIEVEVESLTQVQEALENKADILLLDNFKLTGLRKAVKLIGKKAKTEISGGVTLQSLKTYAQLGVDGISVGAITHSAHWMPIYLEFE